MYQFLLFIHVFAAVCIVSLVLVQQGKGSTMGSAFGSGASQTVFGSRGSGSFLLKVTIGFAAFFFLTSIGLNYMAARTFKQNKMQIEAPIIPISNGSADSSKAKEKSAASTSDLNKVQQTLETMPILPGSNAKPSSPTSQ